MFMALTNSFLSCAIYCCANAHILTKLLQQCFLFFIVVVILGHNLGNSQVSVYRTIGPTLVLIYIHSKPLSSCRELLKALVTDSLV